MSGFAELARMLHWRPKDPIVTLAAFFDESGEHDPATGHLTRLTIAGAVARLEEWEAITPLWGAALDGRVFHMVDFESRSEQFAGYRDPENEPARRALLGELLDAATSPPLRIIGISMVARLAPGSRPHKKAFRDAYARALAQVINASISASYTLYDRERLNLVFATHKNFSEATIGEYCAVARANVPYLGSCTTSTPECTPELQIADLIAYEVKHHAERPDRPRYPWRRLTDDGRNPAYIDIRDADDQPF